MILKFLKAIDNICTDIDECQDESSCSDTENSQCINTSGGYQCICQRGHVMYKEGYYRSLGGSLYSIAAVVKGWEYHRLTWKRN